MRFRSELIFEAFVQIGVHSPTSTEIIARDDQWNELLNVFEIVGHVIALGTNSPNSIEELAHSLGYKTFRPTISNITRRGTYPASLLFWPKCELL